MLLLANSLIQQKKLDTNCNVTRAIRLYYVCTHTHKLLFSSNFAEVPLILHVGLQ